MLNNKTAVITGGGKNIGRAIAEEFYHQGANVIVNDILPLEKCEIAKVRIPSSKFLFLQGDITHPDCQEKLINETLKKFPGIDILINNVGIGSGKGLFDIEPEIMKKSIDTNLIAPFFLTQKIAKQMINSQTKGSIIFISSIHRKIPCGNIDYSASKKAIDMIIRELAYDLGHYGIRVNGVAPGRITKPKIKDKRIPLTAASGSPEDIAKAVLFLTDNKVSGYITGEIITIDGGLNLIFDR